MVNKCILLIEKHPLFPTKSSFIKHEFMHSPVFYIVSQIFHTNIVSQIFHTIWNMAGSFHEIWLWSSGNLKWNNA